MVVPAHTNAVQHKADWRVRTRRWALDQLGGECVQCGSTELLEFDHIIAASKSFEISVAIANCYSQSRIAAELMKCQLLCKQHHFEKTVACGETSGGHNKIVDPQHGTAVKYGAPHRCRCVVCKKWKQDYRAKRVDSLGRPRATEAHEDGHSHGKAEVVSSNLTSSS